KRRKRLWSEFMDGIESLAEQHKKIRNPGEITDSYTATGSVNRSLTDRHYANLAGLFHRWK
ncbi:hypothetical protein, partial [Pectobacterium carotovorum]|uniref:hypothetical protein n=1 Tax=Pectobacterium carotovorum TaxID=554 RepID=UPI00058293BD